MPTLGYLTILMIWGAGSTVLLVLSLLLTNPLAIGPVGVTIWFVLLLGCLSALVTLALYGVKTFLHVHDGAAVSRLRYSWRQGLLIGGWATGVLALGSLHQFNIRDAILLGLLLAIVEVYVRFRWP